MRRCLHLPLAVVLLCFVPIAAEDEKSFNETARDFGLMSSYLPSLSAKIAIGFNYDYLKSLTDVSFDQPKGYMGFNVPVPGTVGRELALTAMPQLEDLFEDTTLIKNGEDFRPQVSAGQTPNMTVRVEVPMLGGVGCFSNIQNFALNYQTLLGNPNIMIKQDTAETSMLLRGTLNVPLDLAMSWETMTFAYVYPVSDKLSVALGLHRHVFAMDVRGDVSMDLIGRFKYTNPDLDNPIDVELDYSSDRVKGQIHGFYDASVWTPSLGLKFWRIALDARFGMKTKAKGQLNARYALPFFIDPESFTPADFSDEGVISDPDFLIGLQSNQTDSIAYTAGTSLDWQLPTGLTMNFDIIPEHLSISYSKLFGDIGLRMSNIGKVTNSIDADGNPVSSLTDTVSFNVGAAIDNVVVMHVGLWNAYFNLGIFGMDFRSAENENVLGSMKDLKQFQYGKMVMAPILNMGTELGINWRLLLELDLLPLPAVRTGMSYYF